MKARGRCRRRRARCLIRRSPLLFLDLVLVVTLHPLRVFHFLAIQADILRSSRISRNARGDREGGYLVPAGNADAGLPFVLLGEGPGFRRVEAAGRQGGGSLDGKVRRSCVRAIAIASVSRGGRPILPAPVMTVQF